MKIEGFNERVIEFFGQEKVDLLLSDGLPLLSVPEQVHLVLLDLSVLEHLRETCLLDEDLALVQGELAVVNKQFFQRGLQ